MGNICLLVGPLHSVTHFIATPCPWLMVHGPWHIAHPTHSYRAHKLVPPAPGSNNCFLLPTTAATASTTAQWGHKSHQYSATSTARRPLSHMRRQLTQLGVRGGGEGAPSQGPARPALCCVGCIQQFFWGPGSCVGIVCQEGAVVLVEELY